MSRKYRERRAELLKMLLINDIDTTEDGTAAVRRKAGNYHYYLLFHDVSFPDTLSQWKLKEN